jgi:hypothetical protein
MSWRAQSRSKDAKTPSVAGVRSRKPKPALCGIQPYAYVVPVDIVAKANWPLDRFAKWVLSTYEGFKQAYRRLSIAGCTTCSLGPQARSPGTARRWATR